MSKMGISTYMSYTGSQIFEPSGWPDRWSTNNFTGTTRTSKASTCSTWPRKRSASTARPFDEDIQSSRPCSTPAASTLGVRGEEHAWTPEAIAKLPAFARANSYATYKEYAALINDQSKQHMTFAACSTSASTVPADCARPGRARLHHRQALSTGPCRSLDLTEAHTTLAIAMNRIAASRTPARAARTARYAPVKPARRCARGLGKARRSRYRAARSDSLKSKIKQCLGPLGVTTE